MCAYIMFVNYFGHNINHFNYNNEEKIRPSVSLCTPPPPHRISSWRVSLKRVRTNFHTRHAEKESVPNNFGIPLTFTYLCCSNARRCLSRRKSV